jgi:hypothetical protein
MLSIDLGNKNIASVYLSCEDNSAFDMNQNKNIK